MSLEAADEKKKEAVDVQVQQKHVYTLNTGYKIPIVGFGTYRLLNDDCAKAVEHAISIGYRHIDTAIFYNNEEAVGQGIRNSKIDRKQLFVTTKLWSNHHERGSGQTRKAVLASLGKLKLDYIDLYLIHSPYGGHNVDTYQSLLKCVEDGLIRSVGVSNYGVQHLEALSKAGAPLPAVNQVELHPWLQQKEIRDYCKKNKIVVESYSPLTKGQKLGRENKVLTEMAKRYEGKSVAQLLLKWNVQVGNVVLAKSKNFERVKQNFDTLDWVLSEDDMKILHDFDARYHCTWDPTCEKITDDDW